MLVHQIKRSLNEKRCRNKIGLSFIQYFISVNIYFISSKIVLANYVQPVNKENIISVILLQNCVFN